MVRTDSLTPGRRGVGEFVRTWPAPTAAVMRGSMQLPGRLEATTLGDTLGALHRERATGVLRLQEPNGACHEVHVKEGRVSDVVTGAPTPRLGDVLRQLGMLPAGASSELERDCQGVTVEQLARPLGAVLVERCILSKEELRRALKLQNQHRLERVYAVREARMSFHVAGARSGVPTVLLGADDFLRGRPRGRERRAEAQRRRGEGQVGSGRQPAARRFATRCKNLAPSSRREALALLGLGLDATEREIRNAFRSLATGHHPDTRTDDAHGAEGHFARLSAAYHLLVA
jgi:hypothetical protein